MMAPGDNKCRRWWMKTNVWWVTACFSYFDSSADLIFDDRIVSIGNMETTSKV